MYFFCVLWFYFLCISFIFYGIIKAITEAIHRWFHFSSTASVGIYGQKLRGYVSSTVVVVSLISHPYGD